jgi:predicted nuclease of predicted toxin-antitoxin system
VRLLFDQNLSARLVRDLQDIFPGSSHVRLLELATASDRTVWEFARTNGYAIISKDADFHQLSFLYGAPPKTIWIRIGNASTSEIENTIRYHAARIEVFIAGAEEALLVIDR